MDRYAVIGHPVAHSLSPRIHEQFARQTNQALRYERLEAPLDGFTATVEAFFRSGGAGCNVTVPFKGEAARWVTSCDELAGFAEAVNTIVPGGSGSVPGMFIGHNTDGPGLVQDLQRILGGASGLRVLLLGAGGAARGVARPLMETLASELVIGNRTLAKAEMLKKRLLAAGHSRITACPFEALAGPFDLVVNATSAGLADAVPDIAPVVVGNAVCYDMVYGGKGGATAFCSWSLQAGARQAEDGLGMLVAQAALAFELWRGVRPDSGAVLRDLRQEMGR